MKMLHRFLFPVLLFVGVVRADCPASCECFDEYVNCNGMSEIRSFPEQTSTLVIQNTQVDKLKEKAFRDLPNLRLIEIIDSDIGAIDSGAFSNFNNLESIFIKNTKIGVIKRRAFSNISSVENIALTYCQMSVIQSHAFTHLSAVSRFEITSNQISTIHRSAFNNISGVVLFDFYLNSVEELRGGSFKNMTSSSVNVYLNSFREIECNTLENILSPAKTHRFYSNNFTCDCGIAWMFQNYFFSDSLNNNECQEEAESAVSGRSLWEADKAATFKSCKVPSACFKSPPTTSTTTTTTSTTSTSTTPRSTTRQRTTSLGTSTEEMPVSQTTNSPATQMTNTPGGRTTQTTIVRNSKPTSSQGTTTPKNSKLTERISRFATYPTSRKPDTRVTIETTSHATSDRGVTTVSPQISKSPRVSRENSQKPDVEDGKTGNGCGSVHPRFILVLTVSIILGFRE